MKSKDTLINEFKTGLAVLVKIRIDAYHRNHVSQQEFINTLITCPPEDCFDRDFIRTPMRAIKHFLDNLEIKFASMETAYIQLDKNLKVEYTLCCEPTFLGEECIDDYFEINYRDSAIDFGSSDAYFDECLLKMDEEKLCNLIKQVQGEISFGTLKAVRAHN
ncbi:hypothetical protein G6711_02755 [Polynucleobacter paneuropaeus]|jgi:hypothetical protein|nr:hypothetical protein [Polynucleobacter paneuropaeus]